MSTKQEDVTYMASNNIAFLGYSRKLYIGFVVVLAKPNTL